MIVLKIISMKNYFIQFKPIKQLENFILINSNPSMKEIEFELEDLKSRIRSFVYIGIELPTDDLLKSYNF